MFKYACLLSPSAVHGSVSVSIIVATYVAVSEKPPAQASTAPSRTRLRAKRASATSRDVLVGTDRDAYFATIAPVQGELGCGRDRVIIICINAKMRICEPQGENTPAKGTECVVCVGIRESFRPAVPGVTRPRPSPSNPAKSRGL